MAYVAGAGHCERRRRSPAGHCVPRSRSAGLEVSAAHEFLLAAVHVNLLLALLNLIPIPPLDGFAVLTAVVPPRWEYAIRRYQSFGVVLLLILLIPPNSPLSAILGLARPWPRPCAASERQTGASRPPRPPVPRPPSGPRLARRARAAHALLPPRAAMVFDAMPIHDQRHALDVVARLRAGDLTDGDLLAARCSMTPARAPGSDLAPRGRRPRRCRVAERYGGPGSTDPTSAIPVPRSAPPRGLVGRVALDAGRTAVATSPGLAERMRLAAIADRGRGILSGHGHRPMTRRPDQSSPTAVPAATRVPGRARGVRGPPPAALFIESAELDILTVPLATVADGGVPGDPSGGRRQPGPVRGHRRAAHPHRRAACCRPSRPPRCRTG